MEYDANLESRSTKLSRLVMHMYKMLRYVSAPCKLQQVRQNADGATI
jgi:hypothetical protein